MATEKQKSGADLPPERIDILGKKFKVKLLEPDESEEDDGYMAIETQTIGLRLQPAQDYNQDTLLHEITHAVDVIMVLGMKERQVHLLASGLLAVLKQNKELTTWLFKDE